jgi:antitoxin (DNA-binding transcriptional repressor) of toxin-antitoxin stability system
LSKIVNELSSERLVVITKNGGPCAVLLPINEDTDIESMVLAQNKEFWRLMDRAHKEGEKRDLPNSRICLIRECDRVPPGEILKEDFETAHLGGDLLYRSTGFSTFF